MGWMGSILDQVINWMISAILECLDAVFDVITGTLLKTPEVTALPQVQALTGRSIWIVDSVFVLAFMVAGVLTMVAGGSEQSRYTIKDLLPRLVVGFICAHFSQLFCGQLVQLANAVTSSITEGEFNGTGAFTAIRTHITAAQNTTAPLLFVILAVLITALLANTAFQLIVRATVLLVMTIVAPLALACHALPQTDGVARMWWRSYVGCLAVPVVQTFFLYAGQWMLLDPANMLPVLGLPVDPGGLLNLLVVIVLLWTTVKVPGLMSRWASQGGRGGSNVLGAIVRVVVAPQVARSVPGLGLLKRTVT